MGASDELGQNVFGVIYSNGSICIYRDHSGGETELKEIKWLRKVVDSSPYHKMCGIGFLPNGSLITYDKEKTITLFEEKRMGGAACGCCTIF
jgi:hypothetical protein